MQDGSDNVYWLEYEKNLDKQVKSRKVARRVDLELPPTESTSWWRLDGYSTDAEQEEDKEHDEEDEEQDEAMAMDDNDDE